MLFSYRGARKSVQQFRDCSRWGIVASQVGDSGVPQEQESNYRFWSIRRGNRVRSNGGEMCTGPNVDGGYGRSEQKASRPGRAERKTLWILPRHKSIPPGMSTRQSKTLLWNLQGSPLRA